MASLGYTWCPCTHPLPRGPALGRGGEASSPGPRRSGREGGSPVRSQQLLPTPAGWGPASWPALVLQTHSRCRLVTRAEHSSSSSATHSHPRILTRRDTFCFQTMEMRKRNGTNKPGDSQRQDHKPTFCLGKFAFKNHQG